jgi:ribulose-phosphate 3-epimerase
VWIQVDGGIDASNIERCADAGASIFVAGSAVFRDPDPSAMIERLRALANGASTR